MQTISAGAHTIHLPNSDSPCEMWKGYFDHLSKVVGKENAKLIWLLTWQENGSVSCTTNVDFNRWLKRHDIDVSSASTRAVADISKVGQNVLGLGKRLTGLLSIGLPIALAVALVILLMVLYYSGKDKDISVLLGAKGQLVSSGK
ncbi:MAG: hypothetical protein AAFN81_23560 [Bacteroidota bacterium]